MIFFNRLILNKVKKTDKGSYECRVFDPLGNVRFHRKVDVTVAKPKKNKSKPTQAELDAPFYDDEEEVLDRTVLACDGKVPMFPLPPEPPQEEVILENSEDDVNLNSTDGADSEDNEKDPVLCFNLDTKEKRMTHYLVRSAGTSAVLYCNPKGMRATKNIVFVKIMF